MCGRYAFIPPADFFKKLQVVNRDFQLSPRYNATPGQFMPVVYSQSPKAVTAMRWGLIPSWAKDPRISFSTFNARSENLSDRPVFRSCLKSRRCLIPTSGFFEWSPQKVPYFIKLKTKDWFVFAGLYDVWRDVEGRDLYTFTIITTPANSLIGKIHTRMPVILTDKSVDLWADNHSYSPDLLKILSPYPAGDMKMYPVSALVNHPENDFPDVLDPIK